jgi:hypothetical protein
MVAHTYNPSYSGSRDRRMANLRPVQEKVARLYFKDKIQIKLLKGLRSMSQVVKHLLSKHKALGSILSTTKEKKKVTDWPFIRNKHLFSE